MATMTVQEAVAKIEAAAQAPVTTVRDGSKVKVGEIVRQGDIYLMRADGLRGGDGLKSRQLVPGTSQGSRHIVDGDAMLSRVGTKPAGMADVRDDMLCAVIEVGSGGAVLTHPEHAHVALPPNSTWCSWSQMDAATQRRVED